MTHGPLSLYRERLQSGLYRPDQAQELAAEKLQSLHLALRDYRPAQGESGWLARFGLGRRERPTPLQWASGDGLAEAPKQGLYIFGEVGRGKSMLMDLFFESSTITAKRRVHFHEFMRDLHGEIHKWRQSKSGDEGDPIPRLARQIAQDSWLLCFDELQVLDIADAMILGRLFQEFLDQGVVVVATSNRPPDDLYKDGLQRERFLPFIALLKQKLDVLELDSDRDYRLGRKRGVQRYHSPLGPSSQAALDEVFLRLTGGLAGSPDLLVVHGHRVPVPKAAAGVACFSFESLCGQPLGASDYLEIAVQYHTLILSDIPLLNPGRKDLAKRFVTLVDALYEHKVTLICTAEAQPENLYPEGEGAFEFQRTVSRLMEMQSADYAAREHLT